MVHWFEDSAQHGELIAVAAVVDDVAGVDHEEQSRICNRQSTDVAQ
jgi:hypothetical protein